MDCVWQPGDRLAQVPGQPLPSRGQRRVGRLTTGWQRPESACAKEEDRVQADGSAAEHRVLVEGALPRDPTGRLLVPFRAGDVLRVAAPFVETVVTSVDEGEAILRWPWRRVDPASRMLWTDTVWGFPFAELHKTLWRTEPPFRRLRTGQR